jgi:hypothetical protein
MHAAPPRLHTRHRHELDVLYIRDGWLVPRRLKCQVPKAFRSVVASLDKEVVVRSWYFPPLVAALGIFEGSDFLVHRVERNPKSDDSNAVQVLIVECVHFGISYSIRCTPGMKISFTPKHEVATIFVKAKPRRTWRLQPCLVLNDPHG